MRRRSRLKRQQHVLNMHPMVDYKSPQTVHVTSVDNPDDVQLNIINHESYAEIRGTLLRSPLDARRQNTPTATVMTLPSGTLGRKKRGGGGGGGGGEEQARVWESTLQRQQNYISDDSLSSPGQNISCDTGDREAGEVLHYDVMTIRTNPMLKSTCSTLSQNDWPPPPASPFPRGQEGRSQTLLKNLPLSHSRYGSVDTSSYSAILDGYISSEEADGLNTHKPPGDHLPISPISSPQSVVSGRNFGRVPSDYEQSSYQCFDPVS